MRALAVADNTYNFETLPDHAEADLILTVGDLYHADISDLIERYHLPVFGVYGNHCSRGYLERLGTNIAGVGPLGLGTLGDLTVLGIEGCVRYKDDPDAPMYTQAEYTAALDAVTGPVDLIVTHTPPRGCNDEDPRYDPAHQGLNALPALIERTGAQMLIHGHTYPSEPLTQFHGAQIRYVTGWAYVDLPSPRHKV